MAKCKKVSGQVKKFKFFLQVTSEDLFRYHWKGMEVVEYVNPRTDIVVQCALLVVDFDCHTMKLIPVADLGYEEKEFWCSIDVVRKIVKNQKLKITKSSCK